MAFASIDTGAFFTDATRKTSRHSLCCLLLWAVTIVATFPLAHAQYPDYVFLIDESKSMNRVLAEETGGQSIFSYVKSVAAGLARQCVKGTHVYVYTFDAGVQTRQAFQIVSESDRTALVNYIEGLTADGSYTHIYRSLEAVASKHASAGDQESPLYLYLYTDGADNSGDGPGSAIRFFQDNLTERGYCVYYTTIGQLSSEDQTGYESARAEFQESSLPVVFFERVSPDEIPPVMTATLLTGLVDFGNISDSAEPPAEITFVTLNGQKFPADFTINLEIDFPEFRGTQHVIYPEPSQLHLTHESQFTTEGVELKISNLHHWSSRGVFRGTMTLTPSDWQVAVAPRVVPVEFRFDYDPIITVTTGGGDTTEVEELNPYSEGEGSSTARVLRARFNETALEHGAQAQVRIVPGETGGAFGEGISVLINGVPQTEIALRPGEDSAAIQFVAGRGAAAGSQTYRIVVAGEGARLASRELGAAEGGRLEATGALTVAEKPMALWMKLLIGFGTLVILALIGLVLYALFSGERIGRVFTDMTERVGLSKRKFPQVLLVVREPITSRYDDISLAGRAEVRLGAGGDFFADASEGAVLLTPIALNSGTALQAVVESGTARVRRQGERGCLTMVQEVLNDGDQVLLGSYVIEIASSELTNE